MLGKEMGFMLADTPEAVPDYDFCRAYRMLRAVSGLAECAPARPSVGPAAGRGRCA